MPKPVPLPPPGFDELSVDEKIDYLQSLWDRIAATPEEIPVPEWHREILQQRLSDLEIPRSGHESEGSFRGARSGCALSNRRALPRGFSSGRR